MNIPSQSRTFYFPFSLCQLNTPPTPPPNGLVYLEQVAAISRMWFLLTFIFGAWKREHVWSSGSLLAVIFLKQFREKQPEILEVPSTHFGLESNFLTLYK